MAYADLKERNADVLEKVLEVLKQYPQADLLWAKKLGQAEDSDMYLVILVAQWSDGTRKKYPEYNRPIWHYVNIPYRPGESGATIPDGESIISAFQGNHTTAKSTLANDGARSSSLRKHTLREK